MDMKQYETRNEIDEPILKVYNYGSQVYGCTTKHSDSDYIVVVESDNKDLYYSVNEDSANYTIYSEQRFIQRLREHHISTMECVFQHTNDPYVQCFNLNTELLRREISAVSSNSFVKCKKKLAIGEDYIGKKSMFHSLRILMFGIQIAKYGRIVNYAEANYLLPIIMKMKDWREINEYCKPIFNDLKSQFKIVAPLESEK